MSLTDDEFTILMIAEKGESMMPIARWAKPVASLVEKGYLKSNDKLNNVITDAGRSALAEHQNDVDTAFAKAAIAAHNQIVADQRNPGVYLVGDHLFFKLLDGSTLTCECIGEPYASKIMELWNDRNAKKNRLGRSMVQRP